MGKVAMGHKAIAFIIALLTALLSQLSGEVQLGLKSPISIWTVTDGR